MGNRVIIGTQWGDEGKGKIVDMLSAECPVIVRFQGGANAGHTIKVGDRQTVLHLVPSGILHPDTQCVIGNGVVLDPQVFLEEVEHLRREGVDMSPERLAVSPKAHLILPYHKKLDKAREAKRGGGKIGTTGRGIGPCYEDKAARVGVRAGDLARPELLRARIRHALLEKNVLLRELYKFDPLDADQIADELLSLAPRILPYVRNTEEIIQAAMARGENVLLEGAQAVHLDIDHGTYPFVTSSNTVAGGASTGAGLPPGMTGEVIGVVKAYTTRVGSGPFPAELLDDAGSYMQARGHEFGATTGRPRRCGWLDAVLLRESVRLNGISSIALTKLDVLQNLPQLKICTGYELDGEILDRMPQIQGDLERVKPVYEELPGFEDDISACESFEELPEEARNYVRRIEELLGVRVRWISTGPGREQTIQRD